MSCQCGSCGLGFSAAKGAVVSSCPYCGKGKVRAAFRDSAQRLLEESQSREFGD